MKHESGFSLVELLVVIGIITALLLVAGGGWYAFMPSYRISTGTGELQGALQLAKLRAIKENAVVTLNLSGTPLTYVAFVDDDGDGDFDPGDDETFISGTFHPSISLHGSSSTQIQLNGRGFPIEPDPTDYPRNLRLIVGQRGRALQVNVAGGVIMQESDNGGTSWRDL